MDFKCIVCNKDIKALDNHGLKGEVWQQMYNGGTVEVIHCGYGSLLDGNKHVIAICDQCLDNKTLQGKALYIGDYMNPESDREYRPLKKYNE